MALKTRKPTGLPSWPLLLLAGLEGAGKTWAAITASASPLIGRTIYMGLGENDPDEYKLLPGADFDIAVHDGTYPAFLQTVKDAVAEPMIDGKPTLLVIDSGTRLWNLIGDNAQAIANRRANGKRNQVTGDFTISTDLWNAAASQWQAVMDALREHKGPVIVTARLDSVTVMEDGKPTKDKEWKVQAHKSLVFDADAVIQMRERGQFLITKVKSVRFPLEKPAPFPAFTVGGLWERIGIEAGTSDRTHATVRPDTTGGEAQADMATRVARAATAIARAANRDDLDKVWGRVVEGGLDGNAELLEKYEQKAASFVPADDGEDMWTPADDQGGPAALADPGSWEVAKIPGAEPEPEGAVA